MYGLRPFVLVEVFFSSIYCLSFLSRSAGGDLDGKWQEICRPPPPPEEEELTERPERRTEAKLITNSHRPSLPPGLTFCLDEEDGQKFRTGTFSEHRYFVVFSYIGWVSVSLNFRKTWHFETVFFPVFQFREMGFINPAGPPLRPKNDVTATSFAPKQLNFLLGKWCVLVPSRLPLFLSREIITSSPFQISCLGSPIKICQSRFFQCKMTWGR